MRTRNVNFNQWYSRNFDGDRLSLGWNVNSHWSFVNNWSTGFGVNAAFLGDTYEADIQSACGTIRLIVPSDMPPPPVGAPCSIQTQPGGATFI